MHLKHCMESKCMVAAKSAALTLVTMLCRCIN